MTAAGKAALYAGTVVIETSLIVVVAWGFRGDAGRLAAVALSFPVLPYTVLRALEVAVDVFLVRLPERGEGRDPGSVVALVVVNLAILLVPAWEAFHVSVPWPRPPELMAVGLVVMAAGAILRFAAVRALGRHFTAWVATGADHELVTRGLYARVRHPGYLAILVFHAGCALAFASALGLVLVVAADLPLLLRRIGVEEAALAERFGPAYAEYAARTPRLWPRITSPGSSPPR